MLTWVVFIGASAAWKREMHVSIGVLVDALPAGFRAFAGVASDVVLLLFLGYAAYLACLITLSSHSRLSPVMHLPFSYVYASAAISFVTMFVRHVLKAVRRWRGAARPLDAGA
jgi:TRAP-type C4-dicarboxylate transport system permease small subunit